MPRITVIGALVYDMVFEVPDWIRPDQAVHASQVTLSPGGKALSQAVAAARLGAEDSRLVGCVGDDIFGAEMLNAARAQGVNCDLVAVHPSARTSIASIVVLDQQPGFIGAPDASRRIDRRQILAAVSDMSPGDILLLNFELPQPLVHFALELTRGKDVYTALNPAPFFTRDDFAFEYLPLVGTIIPNMLEAQLILDTRSRDPDALAREMLATGVQDLVLTLGADGSLYRDHLRSVKQPAYTVDAIDTSGASDAFIGAYCLGLAREWETERSLAFASAAAALTCAKRGTMTALPSLAEVEALLASPA